MITTPKFPSITEKHNRSIIKKSFYGLLDIDEILGIIKNHKKMIYYCYKKIKKAHPNYKTMVIYKELAIKADTSIMTVRRIIAEKSELS